MKGEFKMALLAKKIDHDYVLFRINNWEERLSYLYSDIERWANEVGRVEIKKIDVLQAIEELMQQFDVEPRKLSAIAVSFNKNRTSFVPMGLWVVGSNGRVNIKTNKNHYILVDMGEESSVPSQWTVVNPSKRNQKISFDKSTLTKLLNDEDIFL
jgi:hypothetical protein